MTPELFLERGGELRIVREDFSVYVRYCYVHLSKFSFFSFFPCPFFLIFFSKQIAIPTSIYLQNLASIQPRTSFVKFARSPCTDPPGLALSLSLSLSLTLQVDFLVPSSSHLEVVLALQRRVPEERFHGGREKRAQLSDLGVK